MRVVEQIYVLKNNKSGDIAWGKSKDLKSDNFVVVCVALNVTCKLINEEMIPTVIQQVVELLGHQKEAVRKKAVMALHRFYPRSPSSVTHLVSNFRKIKLLKILSLLGSGDKQSSEQMYTIIGDIMRKSDTTSNIGNAVLYECICCVSSIHHNPKLFGAAADAIAKFLKVYLSFASDIHNLKYLGIDALGRLIRISPEIAEPHQLAVIDCLEDPDDILKRKTFELLYKMTKSSNVEVIVERMIEYMISINDNHYKSEIASRCVELSEQSAPTNHWFIQTLNKVFQHAMDLGNPKVAHNLMRVIAEEFEEDDDTADSKLRSSAVCGIYLGIIGDPKLPSMFLQVICWVLGEYGTADGKYSASYVSGKLCDVAETHPSDDTVQAYAVTALMKVFSFEKAAGRNMDMLPECRSLIESLSASHSTDLQQRAYELQAIVNLDASVIQNIMPSDASCEDSQIDKSLSFLTSYVQKSLEEGAQPYIPEHERSGTLNFRNHDTTHSLRFEAYEGQRKGKGSKATRHTADQTSQRVQPPPHLLDLGLPSFGPSGSSSTADPLKQLEGLLGSGQDGNGSNLGHGSGRTAPTKGD
ncbi:hypothetical protein L1987_41437 [Smallanthus sonchifolius]|uniref:Uncharacterized protein n=1 Tax=Smallanthus sonchifolius TaxID=185202 RepID=A0ACB9GUW8_9ASTR|nr:hypothetical protein L1987_41437 [Smallanthus sonchifolius]